LFFIAGARVEAREQERLDRKRQRHATDELGEQKAGEGGVEDARAKMSGALGPSRAVPGLFYAIPGSAGYTLGPISARLVAECVPERDPSEDIASCSPARFADS
jgi:glycine/D-amino acid oxidase-like deaminating enzyme